MRKIKEFLKNPNLDVVGKRRPAAIFSALLVLASWIVFFAVGPNWGIDFEGGTEIHVAFERDVQIGELRKALGQLGLDEDSVQRVGGDDEHQFMIRIKEAGFGMEEVTGDVRRHLGQRFGEDWIVDMKPAVEVGARIGVTYRPDASGRRVALDEVRAALQDVEGVVVQEGRGEYEVVVNVPGLSQQVKASIQSALGDQRIKDVSVSAVGPKVGADLRRQGAVAVLATLGLVLLYVAFRFDLAFAPGAVLALVHDVSVTVGIFVLMGREFNLPIIGALLTIVGYSLNDTIIIYDRIRENLDRYRRTDLPQIVNTSINETLARTVTTSMTTLLAIGPFLFVGGSVIQDFALAMTLGIFFGSYSTWYVATPMIIVMEAVKPHLARFVATAPSAEPDEPSTVLTESEKRRRARAELDRIEQP